MSVFAYVGLPRSGKSYTAVEQQILPALQKGRIVVTNIPMKREALIKDLPEAEHLLRDFPTAAVMADPDSIFDVCPNGCLVVLDEVWRFWPAGKKVDKIPEAFKSFLAEHGHRVDVAGNIMQVVLVTQDLAQIAAFARQQIEQTFRTTKLTMIGSYGKFRTDIYGGPISGPNPPASQVLRQIFGSYRKQVYQYYTSHTMSEAAEGGANEKALDGRGNVLLKPIMLAAPFLVVGLIWFGYSHLHRPTGALIGAKDAPHEGASGAGAAPLAPTAPASGTVRAGVPASWWVSGILEGADTAFVTDGHRTELVELTRCKRTRFEWWCPSVGAGKLVSSRAQSVTWVTNAVGGSGGS